MAIRILIPLLTLGLFLPHANAQLDASQKAHLRQALVKYHQSRTLGEFVTKLKGQIPEEYLKFAMSKIAGQESASLPRLKAQGEDGFVIFLDETPIPISYGPMPEGKFSVDNKIVNLQSAHNMEEEWQRILSALPKSGDQHALFNLFLPQAHAIWGQIAAGTITVTAYLIYYMLDSDPCDDVIANLHGCENAIEPFTVMQHSHTDWPWEGSTEDRLAKLKQEVETAMAKAKDDDKTAKKKSAKKKDKSAGKTCDGTDDDDDCKETLSRIDAGDCRPSWVDKDAVAAGLTAVSTAVETLIKKKTKIRSSEALKKVGMRCDPYDDLQKCIGYLVKIMRGVCIKSKEISKLKEALDPEATALFPKGNWVPPPESTGVIPESSTKDCPSCD